MGFFDFEGLDGEAVGSVREVLESIGADLGRCDRVAITRTRSCAASSKARRCEADEDLDEAEAWARDARFECWE